MQLDPNLWISVCEEGREVMTTGLFFLVGSLSQLVPLRHSPPQVGCCWSLPCLLTLETKNRVTKGEGGEGPWAAQTDPVKIQGPAGAGWGWG